MSLRDFLDHFSPYFLSQIHSDHEIYVRLTHTLWVKICFLQPYNIFSCFSYVGEAASWLFERAKKRDAKRKENKKSDWLFERASSRKRFHNLLTESEWYNRRLYNKYCDDGDCTTIDQVSQQSNPRLAWYQWWSFKIKGQDLFWGSTRQVIQIIIWNMHSSVDFSASRLECN